MDVRARRRGEPGWGGAGRLVPSVVMVLALVGCGGIHETRPVLVGPAVGREPVIGQPSVIPEGPRRGDAPDGIVRGFLAAAAGFAELASCR